MSATAEWIVNGVTIEVRDCQGLKPFWIDEHAFTMEELGELRTVLDRAAVFVTSNKYGRVES